MEGTIGGGVRVVSRHMVRPLMPPQPPPMANGNGYHHHPRPMEEVEVIHLTPWDLRMISIDYIQKGILLPKPPAGAGGDVLVSVLASSFARALRLFYPFAGRLATEERGDGTVAVFLRCTGEGAELVHRVAPGVAVADIVSTLRTPPVVWDLYPLARVLGADAAIERRDCEPIDIPVLSVQVTELADGVFVGMTLNHSVGDDTAFWHFFNTWSEIRRGVVGSIGDDDLLSLSTPPPVLRRWFLETCPVPIHMPFRKLEHIVRRFKRTPVQEFFFTFSAASVKKLKARANREMAGTTTATISSLQAVLAHLWRAVCRARRLSREQATFYSVVVGCRGRVPGIPPGYVGNAMVIGRASATVGEVEEKGLGWTAWQLNRAVASFDEAAMSEWPERWVRDPDFAYMDNQSSAGTALVTGSSPRFDVFGNDFGWGKPLAIQSGSGNKADGKATVFEGPERGESISLEMCIAPDALARLVADGEFMSLTMMEEPYSVVCSPLKKTKEKNISCYAHASIPEKLIMGQTPTGVGVFIRGLRRQGHNKGLVHVQAHISDPTDQDCAETMAMQLAAEIYEHLNLQDVKFLIGSDYCSAVANGQLGQQLPLPMRRNVTTRSGRMCEFVKLSKAVQLHTEAHKLAKKARQSLPRTECSFACSSMHDNHGEWCSVIQALQNVEWPGHFSLLSVNCT